MKNNQDDLEFELLKYKLSNEELASELSAFKNSFRNMQKAFNELVDQFPQQSQ